MSLSVNVAFLASCHKDMLKLLYVLNRVQTLETYFAGRLSLPEETNASPPYKLWTARNTEVILKTLVLCLSTLHGTGRNEFLFGFDAKH